MSAIGLRATLAACLLVTLPSGVGAQQLAGRVLFSTGDVESVSSKGITRRLSKGEGVFEGETVRTGTDSHLQLAMVDQALIAVRPESSVRFQVYRYEGRDDGSERAVLKLLTGALRSITGAIGRAEKANYVIKSGTHVIGIRGTDHETFRLPEEGTYNRVTVGGTYLQGQQGRVDLDPGQTGFADASNASVPLRLERTPGFMLATFAPAVADDTGPRMRENAPGEERRLQDPALRRELARLKGEHGASQHATHSDSPAQALRENVHSQGFGKGGKCSGSCSDPAKGIGHSRGIQGRAR